MLGCRRAISGLDVCDAVGGGRRRRAIMDANLRSIMSGRSLAVGTFKALLKAGEGG